MRVVLVLYAALARSFMDLDVAVVALFISHRDRSTRVEQKHEADDHTQYAFGLAHRLGSPLSDLFHDPFRSLRSDRGTGRSTAERGRNACVP